MELLTVVVGAHVGRFCTTGKDAELEGAVAVLADHPFELLDLVHLKYSVITGLKRKNMISGHCSTKTNERASLQSPPTDWAALQTKFEVVGRGGGGRRGIPVGEKSQGLVYNSDSKLKVSLTRCLWP